MEKDDPNPRPAAEPVDDLRDKLNIAWKAYVQINGAEWMKTWKKDEFKRVQGPVLTSLTVNEVQRASDKFAQEYAKDRHPRLSDLKIYLDAERRRRPDREFPKPAPVTARTEEAAKKAFKELREMGLARPESGDSDSSGENPTTQPPESPAADPVDQATCET